MRFQYISIVIGCVIFLLSCTNSRMNNKHMTQVYVYECDDVYNFTASIEDGAVWLFLPDQTVKLPISYPVRVQNTVKATSFFGTKVMRHYLK